MPDRAKSGKGLAEILVVDDNVPTLQMLVEILHKLGYSPRPALDGRLAVESARNNPPDLVLLDVSMPEKDGYWVCQALKAEEKLKTVPVIFLTALYQASDKTKAFLAGGVDYITKPFQVEELKARIENHLRIHHLQVELQKYNRELEERVSEQVREISASQMATIFALAKLAESRHPDTGQHIERTRTFCRLLAVGLQSVPGYRCLVDSTFVENIYHASPLHDIGKVGISDATLLKPGRYNRDEFLEMQQHTLIGARTLEAVRRQYPHNSFLAMGIEIARSHHEKWDGSGYPDGVEREAIPLSARIMAIADVYDALRSKRAYKPALSHSESRSIILADSGKHFDPSVVAVFEQLDSEFETIRDRMDDSDTTRKAPPFAAAIENSGARADL